MPAGAAPPKPVTRQPVPWDPWCWLEVQIATATGSTADPQRVGYWQADTPDTADQRYTVWQADGVTIPPAGTTPASGYGEWVQGTGGSKWSSMWNNISWRAVDCDLVSATFFTGSNPWDWNASPGNGTLRLIDNDQTFFPAGPGVGYFDDIGVNTPVRVVANLTAAFDQVPANAAARMSNRVLITGLIRAMEHELTPAGTGTTTIHFSEPHVLYGRVNREAISVPYSSNENLRYQAIHALSDDPATGLMEAPLQMNMGSGGLGEWQVGVSYPATEIAADLWTEICKTGNGACNVMALRLYPEGTNNANPRVGSFVPVYPAVIAFPDFGWTFGLDTRILSDHCSPPDATFNYTNNNNAARAKLSNCPTGSIQFGHDDAQLANVVSIAATGGTAVEKIDQASIDRFYRHSYQRHDLPFTPEAGSTDMVAGRYIRRLRDAVYNISDCNYMISEPRDFEFAVGCVGSGGNTTNADHPPVEPARWMKLDWDWIAADLRVTKVAHDITPSGWTVTHSYEVHNPTEPLPARWDAASWDRDEWET